MKRSYPFKKTKSSKRRRFTKRVRYYGKRRIHRSKFRGTSKFSRYSLGTNKIVKCKWMGASDLTIPSPGGTALIYGTSILMNYPWDPWNSVTGTFNLASAGYTLWSKLFNYYTTLGSKLVIKFSMKYPATSGPIQPVKWGVKLDDDASSSYTTWHGICSDPLTKARTYVMELYNIRTQTLVIKYSPRKFFGLKDFRDEDTIGGAIGSAPSRKVYAIPFVQVLDETTQMTQTTFQMEYVLYQTVRFTKPTDISALNTSDALVEQ